MNFDLDPDLLAKAHAGDKGAVNEIAYAHRGLVGSVIRKRFGNLSNHEELFSVGYLALADAVIRFDPSIGGKFSTFATITVYGILRNHLRAEARRSAINERVIRRHGQVVGWFADPDFLGVENSDQADKLLAALEWMRGSGDAKTKRHATIIDLHFGFDPRGPLNFHEIAEIVGISHQRVSIVFRQAIESMCRRAGVEPPKWPKRRADRVPTEV